MHGGGGAANAACGRGCFAQAGGGLPTLASGEHIMALRLFEKLVRLSDILYNLVVWTNKNEGDVSCGEVSLAFSLGRRPGHACYLPTSATTDGGAACAGGACHHYESERNSIFALHDCSDLCDELRRVTIEQGCCLLVREAALQDWWANIRQPFDFKVDWRGAQAAWRHNTSLFRAPHPCQTAADAAIDGSHLPVFESCFFEKHCDNHDFPAASCCRNISCSFGRAQTASSCYCRCDQGWAGPLCDQNRAHALVDLVVAPLSMTSFLREKQERFAQMAAAAGQLSPADFEWDSIDNR